MKKADAWVQMEKGQATCSCCLSLARLVVYRLYVRTPKGEALKQSEAFCGRCAAIQGWIQP